MLVTIADQHLRPTRHAENCAHRCASGCPIHEYEANLHMPVLPSEIRQHRQDEERLAALAAIANQS